MKYFVELDIGYYDMFVFAGKEHSFPEDLEKFVDGKLSFYHRCVCFRKINAHLLLENCPSADILEELKRWITEAVQPTSLKIFVFKKELVNCLEMS